MEGRDFIDQECLSQVCEVSDLAIIDLWYSHNCSFEDNYPATYNHIIPHWRTTFKSTDNLLTTNWHLVLPVLSTTYWQSTNNWLTTYQQLTDNLLTTDWHLVLSLFCQQPTDNLPTTDWQPTDNLLTTDGQPTDNLPTTDGQPTDNWRTTYRQLTDNLPTTDWQPTDNWWTTYQKVVVIVSQVRNRCCYLYAFFDLSFTYCFFWSEIELSREWCSYGYTESRPSRPAQDCIWLDTG